MTSKSSNPSNTSPSASGPNEKTRPEQALFGGQVNGFAVTFFQNERPPCGLAGIFDWYFHGALSRFLQTGAATGTSGECIYLPIQKNNLIYHLILLGAGESAKPGQRSAVPHSNLQILLKNLTSLKLKKIGISQADFGNSSIQSIESSLKGVPLWICP